MADANTASQSEPSASDIRLVIAASSAGTVFEWYDFFIYGTLAAIIGKTFFSIGQCHAGNAARLGRFRRRLRISARSARSCSAISATSWAASTPSSSRSP
jgi:hypothetical protein